MSFATTPDYPRPWLYLNTHGDGSPLLVGGVIDQAVAAAVARFPLVTLNTTLWTDSRRDILAALRGYNPNCRVLWYDTFVDRFLFASAGTMWKAEWDLAVGPPDARLWCVDGTTFPDNHVLTDTWIDTGKIKEDLLALWVGAYGDGTPATTAEGFFLDYAHGQTYGTAANLSPLDLARAGYATAAELNASSTAGLDYVVDGLTPLGAVFGNGNGSGSSHDKSSWTGELFEGWGSNPPLNYASFDAAMTALAAWRGPGIDGGGTGLVKVETSLGTAAYSATWNRLARFSLGSATIQGGYGFIGPDPGGRGLPPTFSPYYATLWADEFSVSRNGAHDASGVHTGWLGRPKELPVKDPASGIYVRRFTRGAVVVNGQTFSATINMGTNHRRIMGTHDTTVNNGATQRQVTVPAKDAVFLMNQDSHWIGWHRVGIHGRGR